MSTTRPHFLHFIHSRHESKLEDIRSQSPQDFDFIRFILDGRSTHRLYDFKITDDKVSSLTLKHSDKSLHSITEAQLKKLRESYEQGKALLNEQPPQSKAISSQDLPGSHTPEGTVTTDFILRLFQYGMTQSQDKGKARDRFSDQLAATSPAAFTDSIHFTRLLTHAFSPTNLNLKRFEKHASAWIDVHDVRENAELLRPYGEDDKPLNTLGYEKDLLSFYLRILNDYKSNYNLFENLLRELTTGSTAPNPFLLSDELDLADFPPHSRAYAREWRNLPTLGRAVEINVSNLKLRISKHYQCFFPLPQNLWLIAKDFYAMLRFALFAILQLISSVQSQV